MEQRRQGKCFCLLMKLYTDLPSQKEGNAGTSCMNPLSSAGSPLGIGWQHLAEGALVLLLSLQLRSSLQPEVLPN